MYNTSRYVLAAALIAHLLDYGRGVAAYNSMLPPGEPHIDFKPKFPRIPYNKYAKPHASNRECARRRGGDTWKDFKVADRARRGLTM